MSTSMRFNLWLLLVGLAVLLCGLMPAPAEASGRLDDPRESADRVYMAGRQVDKDVAQVLPWEIVCAVTRALL